jgi:hypothetical protein
MTIYTISLSEAQTRISDWQDAQADIKAELSASSSVLNSAPLNIHAFTVSLDNLKDLIRRIDDNNTTHPSGSENINAVRFYAASKATATDPEGCLVYVAVTGFDSSTSDGGEDVLTLPAGQTGETSGIYDFSFPCPTTCPPAGSGIMDA